MSAISRTLRRPALAGDGGLMAWGIWKRVAVALAVVVVLLSGGWLWLRDSSLVAVRQVRIVGLAGPDVAKIRSDLQFRARRMTTLDVNEAALRAVVSAYPFVHGLQVSTQFPHGLTIEVDETVAVAAVRDGDRLRAVDANGRLLPRAGTSGLPLLSAAVVGDHGIARGSSALLAAAAAAPYAFLSRIASITQSRGSLMAQIAGGPTVVFGDATQLARKWRAVLAVLADAGSRAAMYIDVTDPVRPAAGSAADTNALNAAAGASAAVVPSTTASSGGNTGTASQAASATAGGAASGAAAIAPSGSTGSAGNISQGTSSGSSRTGGAAQSPSSGGAAATGSTSTGG